MTPIKSAIAAMTILLIAACSQNDAEVADQTVKSDGPILAKASASFSDVPFESKEIPEGATVMPERSGNNCVADPQSDCTFIDQNGVEHHYLDGLRIKSLTQKTLSKGAISAFNIGDTKGTDATKERIANFVGNSDFRCEDMREEFETGVDTICYIDVGDGWATFHFFEDQVILVELSSGDYL